jgi:hypothetical protein
MSSSPQRTSEVILGNAALCGTKATCQGSQLRVSTRTRQRVFQVDRGIRVEAYGWAVFASGPTAKVRKLRGEVEAWLQEPPFTPALIEQLGRLLGEPIQAATEEDLFQHPLLQGLLVQREQGPQQLMAFFILDGGGYTRVRLDTSPDLAELPKPNSLVVQMDLHNGELVICELPQGRLQGRKRLEIYQFNLPVLMREAEKEPILGNALSMFAETDMFV